MDSRESYLTRALKTHDRELLCKKDAFGQYRVYRKGTRWQHFDIEGVTLSVPIKTDLFILALTDNWSTLGKPVEWGAEPLIQKIKESDFERDGILLADKLRKERDREEELRKRAQKHELEAYIKEWRPIFAKATSDINTASMNKIDNRRKKENGYSK